MSDEPEEGPKFDTYREAEVSYSRENNFPMWKRIVIYTIGGIGFSALIISPESFWKILEESVAETITTINKKESTNGKA